MSEVSAASSPPPLSSLTAMAVSEETSAVSGREASAKGGTAGKDGGKGAKLSAVQRKAMDAMERKKAEQVAAEVVRAQSLASLRWSDCLQCLSSSLPLLADNPYLCILQPPFLYDYLDSLTETLANLSSHSEDLTLVRALLQSVYQSFVELGRFAKYQPAFYFNDANSLRRFIRLMEQVSHKQSDKALYPNILSLLTPTFSRAELYPLLQELRLLRCLLAFTTNGWIPSPHTSSMLFAILEEMTSDESMRRHLQAEVGWERLCKLTWGREAGLSREQQQRGQQALQWAEADLPDEWKAGANGQGEGDADEAEDDEDEDEDRSAHTAADAAQQPSSTAAPQLQMPAKNEDAAKEAEALSVTDSLPSSSAPQPSPGEDAKSG